MVLCVLPFGQNTKQWSIQKKGGYAVSDFYPIIEVQENWDIQQEDMGTKPKFWYRASSDADRWLFKYPRSNNGVITGDHLAEKIAAEAAGLLECV